MSEIIPYVYLAKREDGPFKVGFSSTPEKRMKELRGTFGRKFKLIKTWQRSDAYRVEKMAHRLLRKKLHLETSGWETFKGPRKIMVAAIEEAIKICDMYKPIKQAMEEWDAQI